MLFAFAFIVVLGALCSLDTVSVLQGMIARPIVSATIGGAMLGRTGDGLIAGVVLELFALDTLPVGASRYPEWGSAGVVAGTTLARIGTGWAGALPVAVLAGLATAWLGSTSMVWHRRAVARVAADLREALAAGTPGAVARLHLIGITSDFWRGALVTAVGVLVAWPLSGAVVTRWHASPGPSAAWPVMLAVAVAAGVLVRAARAVPRAGAFLVAGAAVGIVVVLAR